MTDQLENKNQYNNETNDSHFFHITKIIVIKKVLSKDIVII
jgi:hypothetical protein